MLKKIQKIYEDNKDIKYSWVDKNGDIHEHISDGYIRKFRMQTPEEILKSKIGNCWETVELTRYFLFLKLNSILVPFIVSYAPTLITSSYVAG